MPDTAVETTGRPGGHRLDQHVRDAVPVAVGVDPAGQGEHVGAAVEVEQLALGQRAGEPDHVAGSVSATSRRTVPASGPSSPAMTSSSVDAAVGAGSATASTRTSKPFFGTSRPTATTRSRSGGSVRGAGSASAPGPRSRAAAGEVGVQAVVDEVHVRASAPAAAGASLLAPVQVTTNDGGAHLAAQQAGRVQRLPVDVLGVAGERERQPGELGRQPGHGRGAVREVGVQVPHVPGLDQPVGQVDGLQELLEVDRARPPAPSGPDRLPDGRGRAVRGDAAPGAGGRSARSDGRNGPKLSRSQRGTGRSPTGTSSPGRYDGVASILSTTGWCSVSSAGLSTNSRSGSAELLQPPDLAGDEQLGDARVALQDVRDGVPDLVLVSHAYARSSTRQNSAVRRSQPELGLGDRPGRRGRARPGGPVSRSARPARAASASGSRGGTSRPVTPSRTAVGIAATSLATTGRPLAIALQHHVGQAVAVAGGVDHATGRRRRRPRRSTPGSVACVQPADELAPGRRAGAPRPARSGAPAAGRRRRVAAGTAGPAGPGPSSSTSKPFFSTSRPTASSATGSPLRRRASAGNAARSTPWPDERRRGAGGRDLGRDVVVAGDRRARRRGPARRARPSATLRASRAWALNPYGTPNLSAAAAATAAGRWAK